MSASDVNEGRKWEEMMHSVEVSERSSLAQNQVPYKYYDDAV